MPSENVANRLPFDALDVFLDGILAELRDPTDPVALDEIRTASEKGSLSVSAPTRRPRLFSGPRACPARPAARYPRNRRLHRSGSREKALGPGNQGWMGWPRRKARRRSRLYALKKPSDRYCLPGLVMPAQESLFFSMGKRPEALPENFDRPRNRCRGISPESVGDVRAFDNYSFVDIDPQRSDSVVSALNGYEFRGRSFRSFRRRNVTVKR